MSYSFSFACEHGLIVDRCLGMTYNLAPMSAAVGLHWRELDETKAKDLEPLLTKALKQLEDEPEKYLALNPANGWGSYTILVETLRQMRGICWQYPETTFYVC